MSWQHYAACADRDPELFFPTGSDEPARQQVQAAKRICGGCAVQSVCLEWAILAGMQYGVWGGTDENERRQFRNRLHQHRPQAQVVTA